MATDPLNALAAYGADSDSDEDEDGEDESEIDEDEARTPHSFVGEPNTRFQSATGI